MELAPQMLVDAILLGGVYTLMVIGLALSFGITRVINFAHGEAIMFGAYGAFWLLTVWGIDPLLSLPLLLAGGFLGGFLVYETAVKRVLHAPHINQILLTFGLGLIFQNVALILWTGDERSANPSWAFDAFEFDMVVVPYGRLIGFAVAMLLVALLFGWLRWTELGRASRALAEHNEAAQLVGINVSLTYGIAFGISVALGVAMGVLVSFLAAINPFMGFHMLVKGFAILILGGLGNIMGAVFGAFILAFVETGVGYYVPNGIGWAEGMAFAILFAILVLRPRGLLGQEVEG